MYFGRDRDCACTNAKDHLKEFIGAWKKCPEIWLNSSQDYKCKRKKNEAFDKLLGIYKRIVPDCTRNDVKRKLNSLRTNFRKEWKRVNQYKASGINYVSSNWRYFELDFLIKDFEETERERPSQPNQIDHDYNTEHKEGMESDEDKGIGEERESVGDKEFGIEIEPKEENTYNDEDDQNEERLDVDNYSESLMDPLIIPIKRPRKSVAHNYTAPSESSEVENHQEEDYLAKVWAKKLKKLNPTQRLYAEKAINDILFEAELQNLRYKN